MVMARNTASASSCKKKKKSSKESLGTGGSQSHHCSPASAHKLRSGVQSPEDLELEALDLSLRYSTAWLAYAPGISVPLLLTWEVHGDQRGQHRVAV